jgi:hypothetical protein
MGRELRERFPLHFIVFKKSDCHLSHETNVEQSLFLSGKSLSPQYGPQVPYSPGYGRGKQEVI